MPEQLIEAMVLAATADGPLNTTELQTIVDLWTAAPALASLSSQQLSDALHRALMLLGADGRRVRLQVLGATLRTARERLAAFRAATLAASADGVLERLDQRVLADMQALLDIDPEAAQQALLDAADALAQSWRPAALPVEALLEVLLIAAVVEPVLHIEEWAFIVTFLLERPEFEALGEPGFLASLRRRLHAYARGAAADRLEDVLLELMPRRDHREAAYGLVCGLYLADGRLSARERRFLDELAEQLFLSAEVRERLFEQARACLCPATPQQRHAEMAIP